MSHDRTVEVRSPYRAVCYRRTHSAAPMGTWRVHVLTPECGVAAGSDAGSDDVHEGVEEQGGDAVHAVDLWERLA